ncbi:MAG: hypothetical protein K5865_05380 [Eubacterium sp.]|nr:hypothetical protein [Eubacterium sp.]
MGENNYILNVDDIYENIKIFDENEKYKETVLRKLFDVYKDNTNFCKVLIKVTTLNSLYGAGLHDSIGSKTIDVITMAKHILLEPRFDGWLKSENENDHLKAYSYIESGKSDARDEHYNNCYSFASKYCSWHRPDIFPIWDTTVRENLHHFIMANDISSAKEVEEWDKINNSNFNNYMVFYKVFIRFKDYINDKIRKENDKNQEYTVKELDKFLWQYSRKIDDDDNTLQKIGGDGGDEKSKDS